MADVPTLALFVAGMCPVSWVFSLFYTDEGKLTLPGYDLPSAGFGLLALISAIQCLAIATVVAFSSKHPELRPIGLMLLAVTLLPMLAFSTFSYVFAHSRFARTGIWHGLIGLLLLLLVALSS